MAPNILDTPYDETKYNECIDAYSDNIQTSKDNIQSLANQIMEMKEKLKDQINAEHDNISNYRRLQKGMKRIININNAVNISNTHLDTLPYDIYRKIINKNLFKEIKNFNKRTLKGDNHYLYMKMGSQKCAYEKYDLFKPFVPTVRFGTVYLPHSSKYRRGIFIHGEEYCYSKGALICYLEKNGIKGYPSWTFKKLYDKCYSF